MTLPLFAENPVRPPVRTSRFEVVNADVREWASGYDGPAFHAMLTDPPYEIGFMGKGWDDTGVAFDPSTWRALLLHMHPGAFCFAFSAANGWHRMAAAVEAAGAVFHPTVFCLGWAYGSGFPKATRLDETGETFRGHRYGRQALKPALEPVLCFQRPYRNEPATDIARTGAGTLNIDGGRVPTSGEVLQGSTVPNDMRGGHYASGHRASVGDVRRYQPTDAGRWPANLTLVHGPECRRAVAETVHTWECTADCPVAQFADQAGIRTSGANPTRRQSDKFRNAYGAFTGQPECEAKRGQDTGSVSRFFLQADWSCEVLEHIAGAMPVLYEAKASRKERDAGLSGELKPLLWSSGTQNPGSFQSAGTRRAAINNHPTIKPIGLTNWLAALLLPPPEFTPRRLLVPFGGVGSEAIGALLAGWDHVTIVEREAAYCEIAEARLTHWLRPKGAHA